MHGIYKVEKMLCDELEQLGDKDELSAGSLEIVDKLTHALKNTQKIIDYYESMGDSSYADDGSYDDGSYARGGYRGGRSYDDGSYARGRGRNARRDSMGRYSREGYSRADDITSELEHLMENAPNQQMKQKIGKLISEMKSM